MAMLTAIIIAKNEEKMLQSCINALKPISDEIIVVDNASSDRTSEIAMRNGAKVTISNETSFASLRNTGLEKATRDWVLYVDSDERVTKGLAEEIKSTLASTKYNGFIINREDYYFGNKRPLFSPMHRLFRRSALKQWKGALHETPEVDGLITALKNPLLHFTHTDINSMLLNTIPWSDTEAELRFKAGHPPIVGWRLVRVFLTGFWNSYITQQGYKCGTAGWVEAIYQGCSLFITYAKLWELQNKEQITSSYRNLDKDFLNS